MIKKENDLLGSLLHDVAHQIRLNIDSRLEKHNLTRVKWLALGIIQKKEGLTQADLAADLELGTAAVGRLVDRLVEREFIERRPAPNDRRAYHLYLRSSTEPLLLELEKTGEDIRSKAFNEITEQEIKIVSTVLEKIKKNISCTVVLIQTSLLYYEGEVSCLFFSLYL